MKDTISQKFKEFLQENNLDINLSFDMPSGYENAFGTFDVLKQTLFVNTNKNCSKIRMLFTLYHELRHAEQYLHSEKFNNEIKQSINYVVMYNGEALKLKNNTWHECKLDSCEFDFLDIYLSLPYELDANNFAFKMIKKLIDNEKDMAELNEIFLKTKPSKIVSKKVMNKVFREIDKLTEGSNDE